MPYDYDEVLKAKEKRFMWIGLGVALIVAVVAGLIINRIRPKERDLLKDEAFRKGYYDSEVVGEKQK